MGLWVSDGISHVPCDSPGFAKRRQTTGKCIHPRPPTPTARRSRRAPPPAREWARAGHAPHSL